MAKANRNFQKKQNSALSSHSSHINSSIAQLKEEKRKLFRDKNKSKKKSELMQVSQELCKVLSSLNIWKQGLRVALYRALSDELSTEFFQKKYQHKCRFVFPQIRGSVNKMRFVYADLLKDEDWELSPWPGGSQPSGKEETPLQKIDVFLVPGLAFDREGRRLGRGLGFYDRALCQVQGIKIGLACTESISNEYLPEESHDIKMDAIITNHFLFVPLKQTRFFAGEWLK